VPALPVISGQQAARAFEKAGWRLARRRGSHLILTKPEAWCNLAIPDDPELGRGTLRALIRGAGLTVEEFCELLSG